MISEEKKGKIKHITLDIVIRKQEKGTMTVKQKKKYLYGFYSEMEGVTYISYIVWWVLSSWQTTELCTRLHHG